MTRNRIEELKDRINGASINTAFELMVANILEEILNSLPVD